MRIRIFPIFLLLILGLQACIPVQTPGIPTGTLNSVTPASIPTQTVVIPTFTVPPPDLPAVSPPDLIHIKFLDPYNGWGISVDGSGQLLRTVDGGITWLNTTPPDMTGIGYSTVLDVLNNNTVWVLVPNEDFFTGVLFHTIDGGLNWTSGDVPFGGASLQFLDSTTGRAMAGRGVGLGSNAVEMFQTSDGGATWHSVFNDDPSRSDSTDSLPFSGIKNGMIFLDAGTGWVTGTRPMAGDIYLFATRDGGATWVQLTIPLPAGYDSYQYYPQAPIFIKNDGFLPLMIYLQDTTELTFFISHDGGNTWNGNPLVVGRMIPPGQVSFGDARRAWGWDGGSRIYFTTDGSQTWTALTSSLDLSGRLAQMEFVPGPSDQFTGWALSSVDESGHSQLFRTTDNGTTWTLVVP